LRIIETILESNAKLIASKQAWADEWKRNKLTQIAVMLQGALLAQQKVGIKLNVHSDNLSKVLSILPAMRHPTISRLAEEGWYAVEAIVDEHLVRDLIPRLKQAGACDIVEYPLNKVVP
jgi:ATP phosphoribosyltransferase